VDRDVIVARDIVLVVSVSGRRATIPQQPRVIVTAHRTLARALELARLCLGLERLVWIEQDGQPASRPTSTKG
jgi:hypothetical protein